MMCNLQQLQTNLQSLLFELTDIQNKLVNPIQAKKSNTHSFLIKVPKVFLLVRICPYLQYSDIVNLSSTCVGMRKTIYSPIGWKLLSRVLTPYPIIIKEVFIYNGTQKGNFYTHQLDNFPVHMIEDQKLLKKARAECKKNLMLVYEKCRNKEQEYKQLVSRVKSEKTSLKKLKMYRQYLQNHRDSLEQTNSQYKLQLKRTNEGFEQRVKALDFDNDELIKETTKLQNQKEALVGKIRQYQNEIEGIKVDSEKSKQILKKIKNYLLYKQL